MEVPKEEVIPTLSSFKTRDPLDVDTWKDALKVVFHTSEEIKKRIDEEIHHFSHLPSHHFLHRFLWASKWPGHVDAVIGAQWGDEGKGKLVDIVSKNYDICARVAGGSNAGHTIVVEVRD